MKTRYNLNAKNIKNRLIGELKSPRSGWQTILLVAVAGAGYASRASQYLFHPQLFAEDGVLWLSEGHDKTIGALLQPVNGFLHFPERLFGFVVARLPLHFAPLIFAVCAWILFILVAYYLLSSRTKIFTNNYERIFLVLALCLIANLEEFFFNFSNSIFLFGIIGILIMVAKRPKNLLIDICEKILFFLSCLTLPFAWFFLPVALVERFKFHRKNLFFLCASLFGTVVQIAYYLASHVNRSPVTLLSLFSKWTLLELYNQMIIPAIRFARIDIPVLDYSLQHYEVFAVFLTVAILTLAAYAVLKKSGRQVWYLLFFLVAMTFASVKSPTLNVKLPIDALKTMAVVKGGNRYFVYGILAVNIIFIKTAYIALVHRARYIFMVVFTGFGLITSLQYKVFYIDKHFVDYRYEYYHSIDLLESGAVKSVVIPVNPASWHMTLTNK